MILEHRPFPKSTGRRRLFRLGGQIWTGWEARRRPFNHRAALGSAITSIETLVADPPRFRGRRGHNSRKTAPGAVLDQEAGFAISLSEGDYHAPL
jgi:hypothetical protein